MPAKREPAKPVEFEAEVVNLGDATLDEVEAEVVHISQGGANQIHASSVDMRQGGALAIQADEFDMSQSVAMISNAGHTSMDQSNSAAVLSEELIAANSRMGLVVANRARLENSNAVVLLARDVEGSVEPVLDSRGALLAGIAAGIVAGSMLLIGNLIRRR